MRPPERPDNQRRLALALSIGTTISSQIAGGVILGYLLDRWLATSPWLSVTGLLVGTIGAFIAVWRLVQRLD
ncbi:MAG: AtpZ/AtpI family protein [Acidobacteriota bacterium]|jgi:F0F1-type ATP synthase assembly protein I